MENNDFSPIWELGHIPLHIAAAFSPEPQACPSALLGSSNDLVRFEIPKYQRGLVWNRKKKQELLQSLINGWPTGAIVLTKISSEEKGNGRRELTWQVIDGQQRLSSFFSFQKSFWSEPWYVTTDQIRKAFEELAATLDVEKSEDIEVALHALTQGDNSNPWSETFLDESSIFLSKICRVLNVSSPMASEGPRFDKAIQACKVIRLSLQFQRKALDEIPIAVITISPKQGVSTREARNISSQIFEKLNSGMPLSKYDLLAAKWISEIVQWKRYSNNPLSRTGTEISLEPVQLKFMLDQMRTRIENSYKSFLEDVEQEDASIEDFGEDDVSFFDYLYALSKSTSLHAIRESRGTIQSSERLSFPTGTASNTQAFDTCALLFSGSLSPAGIDGLTKTFPTHEGEYDIAIVAEHYLDAAKEIDNKLAQFTHNPTKNKKRASLGSIQASVYLASYMNSVFDTKPGEDDRLTIGQRTAGRTNTVSGNSNLNHAQRKKNFRENLPSWWLLHTISDVFQGSDAYKQAFEAVWKRFEVEEVNQKIKVRHVVENDFMLSQPDLSVVLAALKNLFVKEFRVSQAPSSRSPSQSALALFAVAYRDKNAEIKEYDLDHVIAYRSERNSSTTKLEQPIPLNHVANFMPLLRNLNRSRGNTPWNQYFLTLDGTNSQTVKKDLLVDPSILKEGLLSSLSEFGKVMIFRYLQMLDLVLTNTGLKEYISKNDADKQSTLLDTGLEIAAILNLELTKEEIQKNLSL
jgi:hypothetical protein